MESETTHFVQSTLVCSSCRYDLRGLPLEGVCPECGKEVADSLHDSAVAAYRATRSGPLPAWLRIAQAAFYAAAITLLSAPWVLPAVREHFGYTVILGRRASFNDGMVLCCIPAALAGVGIGVQLAGFGRRSAGLVLTLAALLLFWGMLGMSG